MIIKYGQNDGKISVIIIERMTIKKSIHKCFSSVSEYSLHAPGERFDLVFCGILTRFTSFSALLLAFFR